MGVGKLGYDLYFLVIAKVLNNKYLRLLNFYFHTLIDQHKIKISTTRILQYLKLNQSILYMQHSSAWW